MESSSEVRQVTRRRPAVGGRVQSIATIAVFDVGAPLVAYSLLRSAGLSAVAALLLSGVFPALHVAFDAVRHHRLEVVGALVLAGIVLGAVLGLAFHSARLVLVEGSVPTAVFGLACLGSLILGKRPLMYGFALEFIGHDSARGREMASLWQYDGFRQIWRVITAAWGVAFLVEAALRVVIIYSVSVSTSLAISKVTPWVFAGVMSLWTFAYGAYRKRKGERAAAAS
jgi:intracellular septation protein A